VHADQRITGKLKTKVWPLGVASEDSSLRGIIEAIAMWEDPIVKESRAAREELLERFNYDLDALCAYLEEVGSRSGKKAVTLDPRRPAEAARKVS